MVTRRQAALLGAFLTILNGCSSHKQARVEVPPPPAPAPAPAPPAPPVSPTAKPPAPAESNEEADETFKSIPENATPLATETGLASWYGAPYHNRRGSNGEIYNMHAMTAAHRTLPLGSIVRVTNEKTGHSALVRITDHGRARFREYLNVLEGVIHDALPSAEKPAESPFRKGWSPA